MHKKFCISISEELYSGLEDLANKKETTKSQLMSEGWKMLSASLVKLELLKSQHINELSGAHV